MRTIGVLGGMSWTSTAAYYAALNRLAAERLGGLHSAQILLRSVDFAEIEELQVAGDWDRAGQLLAGEGARLELAGAEVLIIATNTMHKVFDTVEQATSVPWIHLGDATADAVKAAGVTRVGLLGTAFTMEQDFYVNRIASHGLEVVVPEPDDRSEVHRIIYEELCRDVVLDESRERYTEVVERLVSDGCQGVILGCTEIELLLSMDELHGVPLFPTTRIHAAAAIEAAMR